MLKILYTPYLVSLGLILTFYLVSTNRTFTPMCYTITIKLEPYLQEYITCKLDDPVASSRNILGAIIKPFVEKRPPDVAPEFPKGPKYFTLELKRENSVEIRRGSYYITAENQRHIERILKAHFRDALFSFIDDKIRYTLVDQSGRTLRGNKIKNVILQFCSENNITFSRLNYETLKKNYYRKTVENSKKAAHKLSRNCPLIFL